jgi:hypothetical protein
MGASGVLSVLTFTIIPGYVSEDLIVKTSFTNRDKKVIDSLEKKEELGFWLQFFLLFTMPFTDAASTVAREAHYDIQRVTIVEAHNSGIF